MPNFYHSNSQQTQNYKWHNGSWNVIACQTQQNSFGKWEKFFSISFIELDKYMSK